MSLIELQNIGKIYSGENVSVGIRAVNISFDCGEFVVVTGKSGCGKTTLLNVISGMDTYEEGELLIEGEPTSHYDEDDWESYREKYISFIFQDSNIIDSFTVLENVELALMDIIDLKKRREKAMALIKKVGLLDFAKTKGSKLSGGQKQKTVIARALAKDSPIILADEPTGNLDTESAKDIFKLLSEISEDKLVITVTHSFEEVAQYTTRKIRIFDGAVVEDTKMNKCEIINHTIQKKGITAKDIIKKGVELGWKRLLAKPKQTTFSILILIVVMLGIFFSSAFMQTFIEPSKKYVFIPNGNRLVVVGDSNTVNKQKVEEIATQLNTDHIRYDYFEDKENVETEMPKSLSMGRYPEDINEVVLTVNRGEYKINEALRIGESIRLDRRLSFLIVGIKLTYKKTEVIIHITEKQLKLGALNSFQEISSYSDYSSSFMGQEGDTPYFMLDETLEGNEVHGYKITEETTMLSVFRTDEAIDITPVKAEESKNYVNYYISLETLDYLVDKVYTQFSLYFKSEKEMDQAVLELGDIGYRALKSNTTLENKDALRTNIGLTVLWVLIVFAIWLFMILITTLISMAEKMDIAIFRSMGIKKDIIYFSTISRLMIESLIALICGAIVLLIGYLIPTTNYVVAEGNFVTIVVSVLTLPVLSFLNALVSNKRMFKYSVRKILRRETE